MAPKQPAVKLGKFLSYVLGHKPDEFGLVPDKDGYVKIKDLLKAINEEEGWRHIRKGAVQEVLITLPQPPVEIKDNLIRATSREHLPKQTTARDLPGLLYTCVRQKAYPHVTQKGISPAGHSQIILSADQNFAERLGKRMDQKPVVLTVHMNTATQKQVEFLQSGGLFLADFIPVGSFTGPPLPKEKPEPKPKEQVAEPKTKYYPGSFTVDLNRKKNTPKSFDPKKKSRSPDWKKDRKKVRKQKEKMWPS